jgi:hypothetical protein
LGTAIQGVAHAELSFQGALPYAKERRSMRALSGKKEPEQVADALIWHPDVRRMLLTQKAIAEGGRAMIYARAQICRQDVQRGVAGDQAKYKKYDDELGFYTPILKGFLTEMGLEAANLGMQVFGGHGYIGEHGMEQIVRDARISTLYEGTTGIQALDLLGRKVLLNTKGKCVRDFSWHGVAFRQTLCAAAHAHGPDGAHAGAPHRAVEPADHADHAARIQRPRAGGIQQRGLPDVLRLCDDGLLLGAAGGQGH